MNIVYNNFPWPACLATKNAEDAKEEDESLRTLRSLRQKIVKDRRLSPSV